ncbi:MAG TPA: DNA recombination/repair protein RecA, partial [Patescibacteria group bacterium]|nr:DNA recombination/repair protein RecA [Patescibacteria group bacterium]
MATKTKSIKKVQPTENSTKSKALDIALESIEKQFGKGSIMKLGETHHSAVETTPSGSFGLDLA